MNTIPENAANTSIQLGLLDAIGDLLAVHPTFWLGILVLGAMLLVISAKNRTRPRAKTTILLAVLYYYLYVILTNVVGIPNVSEFMRLARLGEPFFNPNLNLIPLHGGIRLDFILNIFLFIPLGFLCPLISKRYQCEKNILLLGGGLSLAIEIAQLFTLYRATDIDDLLTNIAGALIGYGCFKVLRKIARKPRDAAELKGIRVMPAAMAVTAFITAFFS